MTFWTNDLQITREGTIFIHVGVVRSNMILVVSTC